MPRLEKETQMDNTQKGFTLIELITVIVILGILAAVALPKFAGIETQARIASLEGLRGTLQSAAALAHAQWLAEGATSGGSSIQMEGVTVTLDNFGWPTADTNGISNAINLSPGDYTDDGSGTFGIPGRTNCQVGYSLSGTVSPPTTTLATTGC